MMYNPQRNYSIMARKPMVYDRERNGSARSVKGDFYNEGKPNAVRYDDKGKRNSENFLAKNESPRYTSQLSSSQDENGMVAHFRVSTRGAGVNNRSRMVTSGYTQTEGSGVLSQPRYFLKSDKLRMMSDAQLQNLVENNDDAFAKGILHRRRRSRNEPSYFPEIHPQKYMSMRSSQSEPTWMEYRRPPHFIHDRMYTQPRSLTGINRFNNSSFARKVVRSEKAITFYRNFESTHPEIRMVLNENRFHDLYQLVDELAKILNLTDHERYIHSSYGTIIRDLSEFEDGGAYFFGPPYIYEFGQYYKFREQLTPDLIESDIGTVSEQNKHSPDDPTNEDGDEVSKSICKEIKIVSNIDGILRPIRFLVEARRHKSLFQVLHDLSELFAPRYGRVEGLCTRKGRTGQILYNDKICFRTLPCEDRKYYINKILKVSELLEGDEEEEYVAICTPIFDESAYYDRHRYFAAPKDSFYLTHRSNRSFPIYDH